MKLPRPIVMFGVLAALILVILAGIALILPRLIDSQPIRDTIGAEVAKKTGGNATFGKIALFWFPRPRVVIENAELSFDDKTSGSIRAVTIYPSIVYLFSGRVVLRRAQLQEPQVIIRLPESPAKPFDLDELENQIHSVLARLTTEALVPRMDLSEGSAEIRIGDHQRVIFENIRAHAVSTPAELRFELSARSNLCEGLKIEGKISPVSLASRLEIGVQRLKIKESLALLPQQIFESAPHGEATFDVKIASVGLRQVKASVDGSVGPFVIARHGGAATFEAKRLKASVIYEDGSFQANVEQLDLGSPRLHASGELKIHSGLLSARIGVRDVDIAEAGELVLRVVDDAEGVKKILRYLPAGRIPKISVESAGRSFADLALSKNAVVSGLLRDCKIFIPGPDLELRNVSGSLRIADNVLEAKDIAANFGTAKAWDGMLRLGVDGRTAPFHLDVSLHTSAPELHAVLLKIARDEAFRGELLKVQNVDGELSGRLILGERLNAISPVVTITKAAISATYAPIPFPIAIRGGRFSYDQRLIRVENAEGSVGGTTFEGLGLALHRDRSRQMKVDAERVSLDLQQTDTLLRSFKDLRAQFAKVKSIRGQIELGHLALAGAYDDPAAWKFTTAGMVKQVELVHEDLPGPVTFARGKFDANQARIKFSGAAASVQDASVIVDGFYEGAKGTPLKFEASGSGTIGEQMTEWLSRRTELPREFMLRSPLKIIGGQIAWRPGGDVSFRGKSMVAGGPEIFLDAERHPQNITVRDLTVEDRGRHARMAVKLADDNIDLSFKGTLAQQTLDRLFASWPYEAGLLQGEIEVSASLKKPLRFYARGQLAGSNVSLPWEQEKALVEKFHIEAEGASVLIRSAVLRWHGSRLAVSGKLAGEKEPLRVDLDVSADRLDWKELGGSFGGKDGQRKDKGNGVLSRPAMEGKIRFRTESLSFDRFNSSPFQMTAAISPSGVTAEIERGVVCGIEVTGRVGVTGKEIDLDVQLAATQAQLEPTTVCLTDRQNDVKGIYSLKARLMGRGDQDQVRRSLKGNFELSARDGEFVRSPGIDATFDYLNASGDFKVAFPDLDREVFPYRFIGVKGRIEGEIIIGDEINVESSLLNLSGQGRVDLGRKQIDGKGLIAVLKPVEEVVSRVPVISSILGGSLVGIPVRVTGSFERPDVTYLSPADVGVELLNIPLRILGMPLGAMRLFIPSGELRNKDITK